MPTPRTGEPRKDFVSRCVPTVLEDGTAESQEQAVAICHSMWEDKKERNMANNVTINIGAGEDEGKPESQPPAPPDNEDTTLKDRLFDAVSVIFTKAPMKTVGGKKFPAGDFLVVEDPQSPTTWHLQVKRNGTPNRGLAGAAWAALFSPQGHRGNRYGGPSTGAAKKKLRALYKAQGWETPNSKGLMLWKEADGTYRWLARYSNNFRDEDSPPEIISEKSHRHFVEMVDKGQAALPELWLWHRPGWKWGQATWLAYDDNGFALAGGTVDRGKEALAKELAGVPGDKLRVSHGMPEVSIKRDDDDPTVIVEHITREISPLPAWAAANRYTGFLVLPKEVQMAIPDEKRDMLQTEWGLSPEVLGAVEAANAADAAEGKEAGIEQKDKTVDEPETPEPAPETDAEPAQEKPVTRAELGEVVTAIGQSLTALTQQVAELTKEFGEVKKQKAAADEATLTDLFQRAVGHEQAKVDGRTSLAKAGPKETEPEPEQEIVTGANPLVNSLVNSIVTGNWLDEFRQEVQS